jgi:hypothetical protein
MNALLAPRMRTLTRTSLTSLATSACLFVGAILPASATTITFSTEEAGTFSSLSLDGYDLSVVSGPWHVIKTYGSSDPNWDGHGMADLSSLQFDQAASAPALSAELQITDGGDLFALESVDLYSSVTVIPYAINGYRDGLAVFSWTGEVSNTYGNFQMVSNPFDEAIDSLTITLTQPQQDCCENPMGLDNIVLTPVVSSVPESNVPVRALVGGLAVALCRRRRG